MSDYAGPILGAVGAIVGGYFGGPGGAQLGWAIGSAIGGAYAASQQVIPGPKIGDVQKQTSQEGGFRPIVYGRSHPIMGNVLADGGPVIVKKEESQGKGGPKVETEYAYRTYAVGICEADAMLLQAWRNGILVYNIEDPSMASENAKFLEYARWYTGSFDQNADPDLEAIYGAGNAPFFRGTAYLVLANEDVTDQRGAWSQWQVRVFRGAAKAYTTPPYPAYTVDGYDSNSLVQRVGELMWPIEGYNSSSDIVDGDLRELLKSYTVPPEGYDSESNIVDGDLRDLLESYIIPTEGYDIDSDIVDAELRVLLLEYAVPPEGYDSSTNIVSGALT